MGVIELCCCSGVCGLNEIFTRVSGSVPNLERKIFSSFGGKLAGDSRSIPGVGVTDILACCRVCGLIFGFLRGSLAAL